MKLESRDRKNEIFNNTIIEEKLPVDYDEPYENIVFVDIVEKEIKKLPVRAFYEFLDHIAFERNLKCRFTRENFWGEDVNLAIDYLVESVKCN